VKIKQVWYLGEALPALVVGIILGPIAAKFIDSERWGSAVKDQTSDITLVCLHVFVSGKMMLIYEGYDTSCYRHTARHGWLSASDEVPLA
jgi:hypothetical protein